MKAKLNPLANLLIGWSYVFVLTLLMASIVYSRAAITETLIMTLTAYLLLNLLSKSRMITSILIGAAAVGIGFVTFVCWFDTPFSKPVLFIVEGMIDLWYLISYNIPHTTSEMMLFAQVFMVLATLVATVLVILLYKKCFNFYLITGLTLSMALFSWFMTGKENRLVFVLFCTLTILSYVRHIYQKKKKLGLVPENLPSDTMLVHILPLALVPVILISFIPKQDQPLQWPWLDNKIMQAINHFEQRYKTINMDYFSLSSTGFNGASQRLGGPVWPNNVIVMEVKADKRTYLRGAAYSWYEHNAWSQTNSKEDYLVSDQLRLDNSETYSGWTSIPVDQLFPKVSEEDRELLIELSAGKLNDILFPTYSMDIKYRNMTTRTVFMPLKSILPVKNQDNLDMAIIQDIHGAAIATQKIPTNTSYKLQYIQPMYGEPLLKKALTFSYNGLYEQALALQLRERAIIDNQINNTQFNDVVISFTRTVNLDSLSTRKYELDNKIASLETLVQRSKTIRSEYTPLNPEVPQRVKDLAYELTKNCTSDYERTITIESYLRNHFTYSLNVSYIPEGKDFVDYFLFEDPQGYCTYFATSMTVLLRSLNIPARYVEGYVLPEETDNDEVYTVTNKQAHAWVEVYFEGFGWLTFEPTAVYANTMSYRVTSEALSAASYNYPSLEEIMQRYRLNDQIPGYDPVENVSETQPIDLSKYLRILPWLLVMLLAVSLFVNYLLLFVHSIRMKWLKSGKKVIKIYEIMFKWLSHVGYEIKPGETLTEFSFRMDELFILQNINFKETAPVFMKIRYGGMDVSCEEIKRVELLYTELKKAVLRDLGLKRYLPMRYIFIGL